MSQMTTYLDDVPLDMQHLIRHVAARLRNEFAGVFGPETVERFVAESFGSMKHAKVQTYLPLFTERFARDRLRSLARVEGLVETAMPSVVFLCVHNSGRSQMAAGWLQRLASGRVEVFSGGSDPASSINSKVVEAMDEAGLDISREFPKPWTDEVLRGADVIVTMGCGDACPVFPGKRYEDWEVADPAGLSVEQIRPIRDEIRARVERLVEELGLQDQ